MDYTINTYLLIGITDDSILWLLFYYWSMYSLDSYSLLTSTLYFQCLIFSLNSILLFLSIPPDWISLLVSVFLTTLIIYCFLFFIIYSFSFVFSFLNISTFETNSSISQWFSSLLISIVYWYDMVYLDYPIDWTLLQCHWVYVWSNTLWSSK